MARKKKEEITEEVKQEVKEDKPKRKIITIMGQVRCEEVTEEDNGL